MSSIYDQVFLGDKLVPASEATLSIASSAVLYGLSVYTVFHIQISQAGAQAFRLEEHYERLINSARIIGIDTFESEWPKERFIQMITQLIAANTPKTNIFARVSVHVNALLPGTRSRGLSTCLSAFLYEATPILPAEGARLKTSVWRRTPDYAIPSRAKVNGAYINSVLAKQDALDSGYDDCIFLDAAGHVCELSAANIFLVRNGILITPDATSDLLEGINRRTVLEIARDLGIPIQERAVDLTELYIADEVFACGTSAFIAQVGKIDARPIGNGTLGPLTTRIRKEYRQALSGSDQKYKRWLTNLP